MAKTHANFLEHASKLKATLKQFQDMWLLDMRKLLNTHTGVDYSAAGDVSKPSWLNEDANGNIDGLDFTRQNYVSGVVFLQQVEALLTNNTVTEGDYKSTLASIAASE